MCILALVFNIEAYPITVAFSTLVGFVLLYYGLWNIRLGRCDRWGFLVFIVGFLLTMCTAWWGLSIADV